MKITSTTKKVLIVAAASLALAGTAFLVVNAMRSDSPAEPPASPTSPVNYDPPTQAEKDETEAHKDELAKQNQQANDQSTNSNSVTPVITNASQIGQEVTVNAYVPGIFENGGSCSVKFVQGSSVITKTVEAFANASTTDCQPLVMQRSDFPASGDWSVTVSYASSKKAGSSAPKVMVLK